MWNELTKFVSQHSLPLFIDATLKTSLILILAIALDRMLARSSAAVRHRVWGLSLWSALLIPILAIVLPQWQLPILPQRPVAQAVSIPEEIIETELRSEAMDESQEFRLPAIPSMVHGRTRPEFETDALQVSSLQIDPTPKDATESKANELGTTPAFEVGPTQQPWPRWNAGMVIAAFWTIGLGWKLVPILIGLVANYRLIRRSEEVLDDRSRNLVSSLGSRLGLRRPIPLYEADVSVVPMTLGILRPAIVVPRDWVEWTDEQRECVLLHELAHIKRFDVAYQLVGCFASAIHWMNPMVWYALRQLRIERELACDDCVLEAGELPSEYAKQLVVVARAYQPYQPSVSVAMASSARLDDRVRAILNTARSRLPLSNRTAFSIAIIASLIVFSIVVIRPVARPVHADEKTHAESIAQTNEDKSSVNGDTTSNLGKIITVQGIVVKPDGTPAIGAIVRSMADPYPPIRDLLGKDFEPMITEAKSNERGEFTIEVDRHPFEELPADVEEYWNKNWKHRTEIAVLADGFGPAWMNFEAIDTTKRIVMNLVEDVPIHGRVLDLEGRPVSGTRIDVSSIQFPKNNSLSEWMASIELGEGLETLYRHLPNRASPRLLEIQAELTTNSDGSFELKGVGRERVASLAVHSDKVAYHEIEVATRKLPVIQRDATSSKSYKRPVYGAEFTYSASPTRPIRGVVVDAETNEPLIGVRIENTQMSRIAYMGRAVLACESDSHGRFELTSFPKSAKNKIIVKPNDSQPYLMRVFEIPDPDGLEPVEMRLELHRGVWITGCVKDEVTKEPIVGARLYYLPWRSNRFAQAVPEFGEKYSADGDQLRYHTDREGNYRLVGLPGPAIVGVQGNFRPYRHGKGYDRIPLDAPKGDGKESLLTYSNPVQPSPKWPDAILEIDPAADAESIELNFELDPGASIDIELVDEANESVEGATIINLRKNHLDISPTSLNKAVSFAPDEVRPIVVHHIDRNIGCVVQIGPEQIRQGSIRMTLLPCATVTGRLMKEGEPLSGEIIYATVLPGGDFSTQLPRISTDRDGRFSIEVPTGCEYSFTDRGSQVNHFAMIAKKVAVRPGQSIDLGTFTFGKDNKFVAENLPKETSKTTTHIEAQDERISVKGVVLKPDRTPAVGATIRTMTGVHPAAAGDISADFEPSIIKATSDGRGEFEIEVDQQPHGAIPSANYDDWKRHTTISASFEGYGPAWIEYASVNSARLLTLQLVEDVPIRGRVIDLEGRPLPNTQIQVASIRMAKNDNLATWLNAVEKGGDAQTLAKHLERRMFPEEFGIAKQITSGSDGSFVLRGIGRDRVVELAFQSDKAGFDFALSVTREIPASGIPRTAVTSEQVRVFGPTFTYTASPSPPISGIVVDAKTQEPLPRVTVESYRFTSPEQFKGMNLATITDGQGHFRLTGFPTIEKGDFLIRPNYDQPYFKRRLKSPDPNNLEPRDVKIELHRGIWVTGRVIDKVTKEPVAGVWMHYVPLLTNEFAKAFPEFSEDGGMHENRACYQTDRNGFYRLVGLPGPGIIAANSVFKIYRFGQGYDEVAKTTPKWNDSGQLKTYSNPISLGPKNPDAMLAINPSVDTETVEVNFELDPGAKIQIELMDDAAQPVRGATVLGLIPHDSKFHGPLSESDFNLFESIGYGPDETRSILALHASRKLGFATTVGPDQIREGALRVKLLPVATVTGRLVSNNKPMPGLELEPRILPDEDFSPHLERITADKEGRFTIELPAGCNYTIYAFGEGLKRFATFAEVISVKPGQNHDLGTLTLEKGLGDGHNFFRPEKNRETSQSENSRLESKRLEASAESTNP